jgi:hypothetical protein
MSAAETEIAIRTKAIELAIEVAKMYQEKGLTRKTYDGKHNLEPTDPMFIFGTAKEIAEYIRGNFIMNYFLPENYYPEPDISSGFKPAP